jgi:hypothetical protein
MAPESKQKAVLGQSEAGKSVKETLLFVRCLSDKDLLQEAERDGVSLEQIFRQQEAPGYYDGTLAAD